MNSKITVIVLSLFIGFSGNALHAIIKLQVNRKTFHESNICLRCKKDKELNITVNIMLSINL